MTWEKDGTHWPDDVRDVHEVEQVEKQPPAPTRKEWTDVGIHHVRYHDAERRLHRADGPAATDTWPDGYRYEAWYWRDKLHRKDGPAVTSTLPDGSRHMQWWEDDKFVREERTPAPTREEWTAGGTHYVMYFDAEGRLHREDGPAYSETRPNGYRYEAWRCRGKLYRKDGPAVTATLPDGSRRIQWWEDGKFVREELIPAPDRGDGLRTTLIDEPRTIRESIDHLRKAGWTMEHLQVEPEGDYAGGYSGWVFVFTEPYGGVVVIADGDDSVLYHNNDVACEWAIRLVRHFGDRPDVLAELLGGKE